MILKKYSFLLSLLIAIPFINDAVQLRDPFLITQRSIIDITQHRLSAPLQNYSLDQLTMVGFVQYENVPWAIIKTPETYQRVTVGDHLGKHSGKITKITAKKITVVELNNTTTTGTTKIIELNLR